MHIGYIYVTSNVVNGIRYVGQSRQLSDQSVAKYLGSGDYLMHAIKEYGEHAFAKAILDYYDEPAELDYAEVFTIARLRAEGFDLYNGGVGGPRAQRQFIMAMSDRFRVYPAQFDEWFGAIAANHDEVRTLIASGADVTTDQFYLELEAQLRQTQDLSGACSRCGATRGMVCRTRTGNPSRNHAGRPAG